LSSRHSQLIPVSPGASTSSGTSRTRTNPSFSGTRRLRAFAEVATVGWTSKQQAEAEFVAESEANRRLLAGQYHVQGVSEVMDFDLFGISAIVDSPLVLKHPVLVKGENMRRAYSSVLSGDFLSLVSEVWEVESILFCPFDHVGKAVFWVVCLIVAVDGNECDSLG
jgi:hypothetical protein